MKLSTLTALGAGIIATTGISARCLAGDCAASRNVAHATTPDIVDTAVSAGSFTILAKALTEAELVGALKGDGPFTVFAPTDEAFAKLPKGTLESLLEPENRAALTSILTYHVVPGRLDAARVLDASALTTLNGQRVTISADGAPMIDGAKIVKTDIDCSNGIIHVIDEVILPETNDIVGVATSAGTFATLAAALGAADLVSSLQGEGPFTVFAPTDDAFAKLPAGTVETLLKPENRDQLRAVLMYHVVKGRVFADQAIEAKQATTLQGSDVHISTKNGRVLINDAVVQAPDVEASNGVIHVIDSVILPTG